MAGRVLLTTREEIMKEVADRLQDALSYELQVELVTDALIFAYRDGESPEDAIFNAALEWDLIEE